MTFNVYSVLWIGGLLLAGLAAILFRKGVRLQDALAFGVIALGLGLAYWSLRPLQTPLMGEAARVQASIGQGKPVLLEFQSPYCVGCIAAKPVVDRIEAEFAGRLQVIRVNIQEKAGMTLAPLYRFEFTPTFIFFDEGGNELWRTVGSLDEERLRQTMQSRP
ncbi:MAG: hypothetical protein Fur0035_23090 [Anaerolineales bacterium]